MSEFYVIYYSVPVIIYICSFLSMLLPVRYESRRFFSYELFTAPDDDLYSALWT